jgi:hypothetical protein
MSKQLFELMQQQQIAEAFPTKKQVQSNALQFVNNLIESGEQDKLEMFSQSVRINEALTVVTDALKKSLPDENFEVYGIKGTYRNGGDTYNYREDYIYAQMQDALKEREMLIKTATLSKDTIYDNEGVEVTKVSTTPKKNSLTITY